MNLDLRTALLPGVVSKVVDKIWFERFSISVTEQVLNFLYFVKTWWLAKLSLGLQTCISIITVYKTYAVTVSLLLRIARMYGLFALPKNFEHKSIWWISETFV